MRAVVANASIFVCALASCELTPSPVGKSCVDDAACSSSGASVHHCELALAEPVCLPGPPTVAAPKNRAPVGTATTIVALAGDTVTGTLGLTDPEGVTPVIVDDGGAALASGSVVPFNGGTALLTIDDAHTAAFTLVAGDSAFVDAEIVNVSDGVTTAAIPIAVAVVESSSAFVSHGGDWSDGASWSQGTAPLATSTALVDGVVRASGPAKPAGQLFGTTRSSLAIDANGVTIGGTLPAMFLTGAVSGEGRVVVADGTQLAGAASTVALTIGARVVGALTAHEVVHASGGELVVEDGASLVLADPAAGAAADLPTLTLGSGAVVDVDGDLAVTALNPRAAAPNDRERTVVVHADASVATIRAGAWRLIADGAAAQTLRLHGALDAVEIRQAADVSFVGVTRINDLLLEGGVAFDGDVAVDTLHIRRIPRALAGSRTIHAEVCDVPHDVDVALPS